MAATAIQKVVVIDAGLSPKAKMLALGAQNKEIMAARIVAYRGGLTAIHNQLVSMTNVNEQEQSDLLAAYPELMFLATGGDHAS